MPKRLSGLAKLEALGITPHTMVEWAQSFPDHCPEQPPKPRSSLTIKAHDHKFSVFNGFIEHDYPEGITVNNDQKVTSIEAWIQLGLPFPAPEIICGFLDYYVDSARGKIRQNAGKVKRATVEDFWEGFLSAWNYAAKRDNQCPKELREYGMEYVAELAKTRSLPDNDSGKIREDESVRYQNN
ncbi:hypothetical protein I316_07445 [Kwoniella heveanensis BCC8398]|uniref:Uncharacterized protein n=1 Tax=Kwoniella heveanensis BCC8398 TaxID=1296120 RepID=A0A1B9GIK8_9TREE|nr:hypothetical protein I316_07445 [Kwoniella heveanensis BCC8398]